MVGEVGEKAYKFWEVLRGVISKELCASELSEEILQICYELT